MIRLRDIIGEAVKPTFSRDRYEWLAKEFKKRTGYTAPGMGISSQMDKNFIVQKWKDFLKSKGYQMEATKPYRPKTKVDYKDQSATGQTQYRPNAPRDTTGAVAAAAEKEVKPKRESLTEAGPDREGQVYRIAEQIESALKEIKKQAGRRPVPGGNQYGDWNKIWRHAEKIRQLSDAMERIADITRKSKM